MPVGDTQRAVADIARSDGITLTSQSVGWLNRRGHLGLPDAESHRGAVMAIERIYVALGGDLSVLATARATRLRGDFAHAPSGALIEIDESQHFTSYRLVALEMYPPDTPLGFDIEHYKTRCRQWRRTADGYFRSKEARGFGAGGWQRQRAYYDALRDLATPAMGRPPLIRIEAADRDPVDAYRRHRTSLRAALGIGY